MDVAVRTVGYVCRIACLILVAFAIFWLVEGTRGIDWSKVYITVLVLAGASRWLLGEPD